jgi:membrane-associated protease RseP (regulator of RpoE activity)
MKIEVEDEVAEEASGTDFARLALVVGAVLFLSVRFHLGFDTLLIIVALIVMIFLHELGHFLTAKAAGMKVTEFFLGFGPRIWSFRRGETEYGLKAIPAGAYVRIIGMSNLEEIDPADEERTYRAKPYWRRLSVAVAGSMMHFLMAFVLIVVVFSGFGTPTVRTGTTLGAVSGPAKAAGLRAGDRILEVDGKKVDRFDAMSATIKQHPGATVDVVVRRGGATHTYAIRLSDHRPDDPTKRIGFLGVGPSYGSDRVGPVTGAVDGVKEMGSVAKASVIGIGHLFSPSGISNYVGNFTETPKTAGGSTAAAHPDRPSSVVGIVEVGSEIAKRGLVDVVYLLFAVNMFIGIFNLTPLLPFDGGHVVIATYEKVRSMLSGRRYQADVAKLMPLTYAVVLVLMLLFVSTIYLDIVSPQSIR